VNIRPNGAGRFPQLFLGLVALSASLAVGSSALRDGLRAGAGTSAESPAVLGGLRHAGSVHLLGRRPAHGGPTGTSVLQLAGPGATARAVAPDAASLERLLAPIRGRFLERLPDPSASPEPKEASVHA